MKNNNSVVNTSKLIIIICLLLVGLVVYYQIYQANGQMKPSVEAFYSNDGESSNNNGDSNRLVPKGNDVNAVLFYADWCPHCVKFKPTWTGEITSNLHGKKLPNGGKINIKTVNAESESDLAGMYNLEGYPTIKIISSNGKDVDYEEDRSAGGIEKFIRAMAQ